MAEGLTGPGRRDLSFLNCTTWLTKRSLWALLAFKEHTDFNALLLLWPHKSVQLKLIILQWNHYLREASLPFLFMSWLPVTKGWWCILFSNAAFVYFTISGLISAVFRIWHRISVPWEWSNCSRARTDGPPLRVVLLMSGIRWMVEGHSVRSRTYFFHKGPESKYFRLCGATGFLKVESTWLCHCNSKVATDNMYRNGPGHVPLYKNRQQARFGLQATVCQLLIRLRFQVWI